MVTVDLVLAGQLVVGRLAKSMLNLPSQIHKRKTGPEEPYSFGIRPLSGLSWPKDSNPRRGRGCGLPNSPQTLVYHRMRPNYKANSYGSQQTAGSIRLGVLNHPYGSFNFNQNSTDIVCRITYLYCILIDPIRP